MPYNVSRINSLVHTFLSLWADDVGTGSGELISGKDNYIEITEYDSIKQELWDKFQATFLVFGDVAQFVEDGSHISVISART